MTTTSGLQTFSVEAVSKGHPDMLDNQVPEEQSLCTLFKTPLPKNNLTSLSETPLMTANSLLGFDKRHFDISGDSEEEDETKPLPLLAVATSTSVEDFVQQHSLDNKVAELLRSLTKEQQMQATSIVIGPMVRNVSAYVSRVIKGIKLEAQQQSWEQQQGGEQQHQLGDQQHQQDDSSLEQQQQETSWEQQQQQQQQQQQEKDSSWEQQQQDTSWDQQDSSWGQQQQDNSWDQQQHDSSWEQQQQGNSWEQQTDQQQQPDQQLQQTTSTGKSRGMNSSSTTSGA